MHGYITPKVFELVDAEVAKDIKVAKRVRELMDYDILEVVQDGNEFWFEKLYLDAHIPKYVEQYLVKIITKRLNLKYAGV